MRRCILRKHAEHDVQQLVARLQFHLRFAVAVTWTTREFAAGAWLAEFERTTGAVCARTRNHEVDAVGERLMRAFEDGIGFAHALLRKSVPLRF